MKLAGLISGGKDSLYALKQVWEEEEVVRLISIQSEPGSKFFHSQNIQLTKLQAEALNLPLIYRKTAEEEEVQTLEKTVGGISKGIDGVVCGAIASNYQREKVEEICEKLGLKCLAPLWHVNEAEFMENLIQDDFEVVITKVAAQGLGRDWLGRKIDERTLGELKEVREKYGIHLAGEGGEYETLVLDCPLFEKEIKIVSKEKTWDRKTKSGSLELKGELKKERNAHQREP